MKKIVFTVAILFVTSLASAVTIKDNECADYAHDAAFAEADFYGDYTLSELEDAAWDYFFACNDAGGADNMLDPIFL